MANGTMLSFVILHGDLEHIVASNADPMDFRRLLTRMVFFCGFTMVNCVRIAHWQILTRNAGIMKISPYHWLQHPKRVITWPHSVC
jgi:hypothetical protein